jgi:N-acylglucosamine 2-epimerase
MENKEQSRRSFLKYNTLGGLALMASGPAIAFADSESPASAAPQAKKITRIAGMSLTQLREKYRAELFDRFIPNMDKYAIDHEHGGVMCSLDTRTGVLANTNKTSWFVGRGMWLYSFLYNNLEKNPRYLEIARKSKDLALKLQPSDDSFWPQSFSADGKPLTGPGDIYGSLFIAEGLFEFAKATGQKEYRALAKKIIFSCVDRYDRPDYSFKLGGYLPGAPDIEGPRVLGHWMIFLSLSTQMLKHEADADLEKLAARATNAIMNYHVNPVYGLTNELINHDMSRPDSIHGRASVIGHGLETIAFVMFEAARKKDKILFERARTVFKKHVDVATDPVFNGYFHSIHDIDKYTWDTRKSLWNQQEVLNGSLLLIEHTGDEWALRHFDRTHHYIYDKFYNPEHKFWHSGGDRTMENPNVSLLEHYHHARELMLGILSLDRIIKRQGASSGLFS